jgi:two-component system chemotaxis response regulator CheB
VIKLLVVDDSALMRRLLGKVFAAEKDFQLEFARDGVEALATLDSFGPDVVTLDVHMPRMDGLACLDRIMLERPRPVVMISSLTEAGADVTLEAMQLGAVDFIAKPQGAMSLEIDELAPLLVEKVRAAARARPRSSLRLAERVRLKVGAPAAFPSAATSGTRRRAEPARPGPGMAWCWSAPPQAVRQRWMRCWGRCRQNFVGPSSWRSTCRPPSPARWRGGWTGFARWKW